MSIAAEGENSMFTVKYLITERNENKEMSHVVK
jgi:hypothetical protein